MSSNKGNYRFEQFRTYFLLVFVFAGCGVVMQNDVYRIIPKHAFLSKEQFKSCEQIILNKSELILLYNISSKWKYYDPHLLFYNDRLTLYAAAYFPSESIESVENNVITAYLNASRNERRFQYRNDLPGRYRLNLISTSKFDGSGRKSDKIIDKLELVSDSLFVKLYVRKARDRYAGLDLIPVNNSPDSTLLAKFTSRDTIVFPVSKLNFDLQNQTISTKEVNESCFLVWDHMIVLDKALYNHFFDQLYDRINEVLSRVSKKKN